MAVVPPDQLTLKAPKGNYGVPDTFQPLSIPPRALYEEMMRTANDRSPQSRHPHNNFFILAHIKPKGNTDPVVRLEPVWKTV